GLLRGEELLVELELVREEEELRAEAPALHVLVEVFEVRVRFVRLEERAEAVALLEPAHERGFSRADRAGDRHVSLAHALRWLRPLNMKPRMRTAGATTEPPALHHDGISVRSRVMPSERARPSSRLSVKRMLPTARAIFPRSTRKQPSRVRPVITARGVSSRPFT